MGDSCLLHLAKYGSRAGQPGESAFRLAMSGKKRREETGRTVIALAATFPVFRRRRKKQTTTLDDCTQGREKNRIPLAPLL